MNCNYFVTYFNLFNFELESMHLCNQLPMLPELHECAAAQFASICHRRSLAPHALPIDTKDQGA
jgi:hypothetical protein